MVFGFAELAVSSEGILGKMTTLQYLTHKTALAVDKQNRPLADFYAHELAEAIEDVIKVKSYDGHPVGKLVKTMLVPSFEQLEAEIKGGQWNKASIKIDGMINACNACHTATKHGYIVIERNRDNPFMQTFSPAESGK